MKKIVFFLIVFFTFQTAANNTPSIMEEAEMLGTMSGIAQACNEKSKKISDFELIAARIIANKTSSEEEEIEGYQHYARKKAAAMRKQKNNPKLSCNEILRRFENMPIFKSVVYSDGSVKLSDGTFLKATRPPAQLKKNK